MRRALLLACLLACLPAAPAYAGTAQVDQPSGGDPRLVYTGGGADNNISISKSFPPNAIEYRLIDAAGITPGAGCVRDGIDERVVCTLPGRRERQALIDLGGGSDFGFAYGTFARLEGGDGADDLNGEQLDGGPGPDELNGGVGGDAFYVAPGDGTDVINGSSGFDAITIAAPGTLDMRGSPDAISGVEALAGTGGNDLIFADDRVLADGRGWSVDGGNGDDELHAGSVGARVFGGNGNDSVVGGAGNDEVNGGNDDDTVEGGGGEDRIDGQNDDDVLFADDGVEDNVICGNGIDRAVPDSLDTVNADCELSGEDRDGDALYDDWETEGIDLEGDGIIDLDLPAMGASPDHKDIFIEIDAVAGHALSQTAVDRMVAAFAAAPVSNPDGVDGIALHVDNGPASTMAPGQTWGALSESTATLPHQPVLGTSVGGFYNWSAFDAIKQTNLLPERRRAFHYVISGHRYGVASNNSSGISRNDGGSAFDRGASDLLVTLGPASEPNEGSGSVDQQAGTLMHELGHNFGLRHGGDDHNPYKPSYLSVMNYAFQMTGLPLVDGSYRLDYSRVPVSIDENALDEDSGFGFGPASEQAQYKTLMLCPGSPLPDSGGQLFEERLIAGPLDWDCDGLTLGTVAADVNSDADLTVFNAFLDWPALVYAGGSIGDAAGTRVVPQESELIEPQLDELLAAERALEGGIRKPGPPAPGGAPGPPGSGPGATAPGGQALGPVRLSGLSVEPGRFRPARRGPSIVRRGGARIGYRLDRAAAVVFIVERRKGRRWVRVRGSFRHAGKAGANAVRFSGRLAGKALRPGRYRLTASAKGGGRARATFSIARPRR